VSQFRSNWDESDGLDAVTLLVQMGADVNAVNASGQTALHGAAYLGANQIVQFLLEKGARLDAQDRQGQTPFRVAEGHLNVSAQGITQNPETAELLRRFGADTSLGDNAITAFRERQRKAAKTP
jgi:ankyrin repeat protein